MHQIKVSLVFVTEKKQWLWEAQVARGTNAIEFVQLSGFLEQIDELKDLALTSLKLGVYAEKISSDYLLEEGDRVEIYRELTADPKEVRRQLALLGKTMGKN
jgi:Uncharacterized protein conserved in bacteria